MTQMTALKRAFKVNGYEVREDKADCSLYVTKLGEEIHITFEIGDIDLDTGRCSVWYSGYYCGKTLFSDESISIDRLVQLVNRYVLSLN